MLRSILAVILGYVAMAVATMVSVALLSMAFGLPLDPEAVSKTPPTPYIVANLVCTFASAALGGVTAALVAVRTPRRHVVVLSLLVLVFGVLYALQGARGPQPGWYLMVLPLVGATGVCLGGMLKRQPSRRLLP